MNVLLINGSPRPHGCTYTALSIVGESLNAEGIETEIFQIGNKPVRGCIACRKCVDTNVCIFDDDVCNTLIDRMTKADGVVVGSPVYYASPNGALLALLDRVFYQKQDLFRLKPAASVVSARRAGTTASLDVLNKYFLISEMPVVASQYWTMVHGSKPEHVFQDEEGVQIMKTLGTNMAWLLKSLDAAKTTVPRPPLVKKAYTNFIR